MWWLVELLFAIFGWTDFRSQRDDRSIVGESELDRASRRLWWIVSLLVVAGILVGALFFID